MPKPFKGTINIDIRESKPDWEPYIAQQAPQGSPNVLVILMDDTGLAAWEPFGGLIEMPTLKRIADQGLRYAQWHTTALCSPSRSCMLTGRNHHMNSMACISEATTGFPGSHGHIPPENAFISETLREAGYNTYMVGKYHLLAEDEDGMAASKRNWPTERGFERFYGFLGAETNQWYPDLTYDNHPIDQPATPEEGYHLSKDLVDQAIQFIADGKQVAPDKPFFLYFCPGANHAPHHTPKEWADKYQGKFDMGYEQYREIALANMKKLGIVPEDNDLPPINPMPEGTFWPIDSVRPWDSLSEEEKQLFARMAEVYAGFSGYTDYEMGRLIDYLEESGQLENTLIVVASDNGASGEGSPNGSVNENKIANGYPDDLQENLAHLHDLGSPNTYNHYPTGWAMAFNTPFKMFKRYSYNGGICDPLVISWPKGVKARGEVRHQYHHIIDIVPTILDCCGVPQPEMVKGIAQSPIQGISMRYSFDQASVPTEKQTQYYAMLGTRALWHQGWKIVAEHGALLGKGNFFADRWALYHSEVDRSEVHDLADQHPEKVQELVALWWREAGANQVLPLDDRSAVEILTTPRPHLAAPRDTYIYRPHTADVPESEAVNIRGRSYKLLAEVDIQTPEAAGVLFAHGSRFGGHTLFIKDQLLYYVYNFLGIPPEQQFVSPGPVPTGKHIFGAEFTKENTGQYGESHGTLRLYIDDNLVASGPMRTQTGKFSIAGEGLCVGRDSADAVSHEYTPEFGFRGGRIKQVMVDVGRDVYSNLEKEASAMLARE
jgi:arylsulfatase A-like enzyme